jgi:hypothetical protein
MRKQLTQMVFTGLLMIATVSAWAQSGPFFQAVTNLNPVAYWPLHETILPPPSDIASNLGTLGPSGNAGMSLNGVTHQWPGSGPGLTPDGDPGIFTDGSAGLVALPFSPVLSMQAPFSAELWVLSGNPNVTQCPLACVDANNPRSGWLIYVNGTGSNPGACNFRLYNQNGTTPSLNIASADNAITAGQWYHVVVVYDGANGYVYINGQLAVSGAPTGFVPNDAGALTIGVRSDHGFFFQGGEADVAIYTNALSAATILSHYQAGTSGAPSPAYKQLVLQSNPLLFYPLNEPPYTAPPVSSDPVARNFGTTGTDEDGNFLPGSFPGTIAGPPYAGFPTNVACRFNAAYNGFVDIADSGSLLNILGPVTLAAWIKGEQANIGNFQSYAGRGDPSYRGDVDQSGNVHFADGSNPDCVGSFVNDGKWHFVVGTWDGANEVIYLDGISNHTQSAATPITGDSDHFVIGGDGGYSPGGSRIFNGGVTEVAIFGQALSSAQILALYNAAQVPPFIITQPTNGSFSVNATASLSVVAGGTPALGYRWYKGTSPLNNGGEYSGVTSATLTISPTQLSDSGSYKVVVTNSYGSITSAVATVTIVSGPVISPDLPATNYVFAGTTATLSVGLSGSGPFTNAWTLNGNILHNGGRISGATTPTLTIANAQASDAGNYQFWSTNNIGASHSSVGVLVVQNALGFNGNGAGWTLNNGNGPAPLFVGNNSLRMTLAGAGGQANSIFFNTPLYARAFWAHFTYYDVNDGADGVCFVVQNSAAGAHAVGAGGGGMGVRTITNSFEVEIDLYNEGFAYDTNGLTHEADNNFPAGNPEFELLGTGDDVGDPGHYKDMTILFDSSNLTITWSNQFSHLSGTTNVALGDLQAALGGSTAYVGLTAACGGVDDTQIVSDFAYVPLPPTLTISRDGGAGVNITWPALPTYTLQRNSSLNNPGGWTTVAGPYTTVSAQPFNQYLVHITPATGPAFYRLLVGP